MNETDKAQTDPKLEYEQKKKERQKERSRARQVQLRPSRIRKIRNLVITLIVLAALGYGIFLLAQSQSPEGADHSQQFPIQGNEHIAVGSEHPPYNSNPPSSGWHYNTPARTGFYEEALPDEQLVHNLEHGEIWIAYHPRISQEVKDQLRELAEDSFVVIAPREANDTDLALVAWGRVDKFNLENGLDEQRIRDFIIRYKNKGPERLPPGAHR